MPERIRRFRFEYDDPAWPVNPNVRIEVETDKFKKVAGVVGGDKAGEVLDALSL